MQEVMRGVGSGPKATSPLQELEVDAHRAPYLIVVYNVKQRN